MSEIENNENNGVELDSSTEKEILVVASKLKKFIKTEAGMNTSANALDAISAKVRLICKEAIANAQNSGRKTVMDRDIPS